MTRINESEAPMFMAHAYCTKAGDNETRAVEFIDGGLMTGEPVGIDVCAGWSTVDEDAKLLMIETTENTGRIRIELNDALIWVGDPEFRDEYVRVPRRLIEQARASLQFERDTNLNQQRRHRTALRELISYADHEGNGITR